MPWGTRALELLFAAPRGSAAQADAQAASCLHQLALGIHAALALSFRQGHRSHGGSVEADHPPHLAWDQESLSGDAYPTYGWGVNVIEVEVDPETFEIVVLGIWTKFDIGVAIDQRIMEGQAHGGTVQGLGYASLEKLALTDGRFEQTTMADYTIPTSLDYPPVNTDFIENPYPFGPFGAKGAGELVLDGAAPALALAVEQAVGRPVYSIPLTPESIMELLT